MKVFKVLDVKTFMQHFLVKESFDEFFLVSAEVVNYVSFSVEGKRKKAWYDEEDFVSSEYVFWKEVREQISSLIKGDRVPLSMKVVLRASESLKETLRGGLRLAENTDFQLVLTLRYEKGELTLTSGSFISDFLKGKEMDALWEKEFEKVLKSLGLTFECDDI